MDKKTGNTLITIAALGCGLAGLALVVLSILGEGGDYALPEGILFIVCGNLFNLILQFRKRADKTDKKENNGSEK